MKSIFVATNVVLMPVVSGEAQTEYHTTNTSNLEADEPPQHQLKTTNSGYKSQLLI